MDAASWKKDEDDMMYGRPYYLKICKFAKLLFASLPSRSRFARELNLSLTMHSWIVIDVTLEILSHFLVIISCTV